MSIIGA